MFTTTLGRLRKHLSRSNDINNSCEGNPNEPQLGNVHGICSILSSSSQTDMFSCNGGVANDNEPNDETRDPHSNGELTTDKMDSTNGQCTNDTVTFCQDLSRDWFVPGVSIHLSQLTSDDNTEVEKGRNKKNLVPSVSETPQQGSNSTSEDS